MKHSVEAVSLATKVATVFCFILLFLAQFSPAAPAPETDSSSLLKELTTLDPYSNTNLTRLLQAASTLSSAEVKESKTEKKRARATDDLKNLPTADLQRRFVDESVRHVGRAASAIERLATETLQADDTDVRAARIADIIEIQAGLRNEQLPLVPERLGFFTTWIFFFKNNSAVVARGTTMANNLTNAANPKNDDGHGDPLPSTFWTRPTSIFKENLYAGFGRDDLPHFDDSLCEYSAPKTSSGTHGGFDVLWKGQRLKIKFGEVNSEPFTARIFDALGYHVDPTDYAPMIKLRYDRRMLREFHLRRPLNMRITPFGVHVGTIHLQSHYDPFTFVVTAVFKDGHEISGATLKQILFKNPNISHPEESPENYRPDIEPTLDYLVMSSANVQPRDTPAQTIGAWQFGGLGHENRRELRGMCLLAAWLAWFDSRTDNTKLRVERGMTAVHLQHFVSDLGGGMGEGSGWFSPHGEDPNDFTWIFTGPQIIRGPGRMTTPFRIEHFKPTVPTPAFAAMTMDDAKWMACLIGQLTENQLRAALIASGYDNAEARLYLEKLLSRRDRMICDLGLEHEIPLLRPNVHNREFSYIPSTDGLFEANLADGHVAARASTRTIIHGKLVENHVQP